MGFYTLVFLFPQKTHQVGPYTSSIFVSSLKSFAEYLLN
jgi:hypothetical protein